MPPVGAIDVAIHARGLTSGQVFSALCAAAKVDAQTPSELLSRMPDGTFTAAIDAIDEALDWETLTESILHTLVERGPQFGFRLLLGTRLHLLDKLGANPIRLNLDDAHYADPASLKKYSERCLYETNPQSPYRDLPQEYVASVADAVANAAGRSFLVALIVSRTLAAQAEDLPDPTDPSWRDGLPRTAAEAMHHDLETRLGSNAQRARDLLTPLAHAQGAGLPWEDIWAPLASLISEGPAYTDEDIVWLRRHAGSYIVEGIEAGRSAYRLYHAALSEYLRQWHDEKRVNGIFAAFLLDRVPKAGSGLRDWARAHPYIRAHLATHAARTQSLDSLLLDPGFLLNAAPAGLIAALPSANSDAARLAASVYLRALHIIRRDTVADRLSYLELVAKRLRATVLVEHIVSIRSQRSWSVLWSHWPNEYPHQVLTGHRGTVLGVGCFGSHEHPNAVSAGQDGTVRVWDLVTAEQVRMMELEIPFLKDAGFVLLPDQRTVCIAITWRYKLDVWDIDQSEKIVSVVLDPLILRRIARIRDRKAEFRYRELPDGRSVIIGSAMRTSIWGIESGELIATFPRFDSLHALEFRRLGNGHQALVVPPSTPQRRWQVCDVTAPSAVPHVNKGGRSRLEYYCSKDGIVELAIERDLRSKITIWDLTSFPIRAQPLLSDDYVTLSDGRTVALRIQGRRSEGSDEGTWLTSFRRMVRGDIGRTEFGPIARPVGLLQMESLSAESFGDSLKQGLSSASDFTEIEHDGRFISLSIDDEERYLGRFTLAGHQGNVTDSALTNSLTGKRLLVSSSSDSTVRIWDLDAIRSSGRLEQIEAVNVQAVIAASLSDTAEGVLSSDGDTITLVDLMHGQMLGRLPDYDAIASAFGFTWLRGMPVLLTFDTDCWVRVWGLPEFTELYRFPGHPRSFPNQFHCAVLPGGRWIGVTSGHESSAVVWDLVEGQPVQVLKRHKGFVSAAACGAGRGDLPVVATCGLDRRINLWEFRPRRGRIRFRMRRRIRFRVLSNSGVDTVRIGFAGGQSLIIAAHTHDGVLYIFGITRWHRTRLIEKVQADSSAIATGNLSDGRPVLACVNGSAVLQVWDLKRLLDDRRKGGGRSALLVEIDLDAPINDMTFSGDNVVVATTNGLTALHLNSEGLCVDD